jgi:hypothetical protein
LGGKLAAVGAHIKHQLDLAAAQMGNYMRDAIHLLDTTLREK